jgi:hypothetical protein
MRMIKYILLFLLLASCSEFLLLSSGAGTIASQNTYVKAYNGVDMLTIMQTDKDIKKHAYEKLKVINENK